MKLINKESQSQQAGMYSLSQENQIFSGTRKLYFPGLKLYKNRSKLHGIKPGLNNKKAQEEMVGFVLIVVIVVLIGVVFLGISLRNSSSIQRDSIEISNLLNSITSYTSDCQIPDSIYRNINELTTDCYNNKLCSDGRNSCSVLESTLKDMLNNSFTVTIDSYTKYYQLRIEVNSTNSDLISPIVSGPVLENCKTGKMSNQKTIISGSNSDRMIISLILCNNER